MFNSNSAMHVKGTNQTTDPILQDLDWKVHLTNCFTNSVIQSLIRNHWSIETDKDCYDYLRKVVLTSKDENTKLVIRIINDERPLVVLHHDQKWCSVDCSTSGSLYAVSRRIRVSQDEVEHKLKTVLTRAASDTYGVHVADIATVIDYFCTEDVLSWMK